MSTPDPIFRPGRKTSPAKTRSSASEQLAGADIDSRTVFAFGAVLYEMLTGKKAFTGKSQASLFDAILKDEAPSLSDLRPASPPHWIGC